MRRGFSLIEVLVVAVVLALLIALLLPGVQKVRAAAAREVCAHHLRQLGLAMHAHHDLYDQFPTGGTFWSAPPTYFYGVPAVGASQNAGWGFQLLPFIEQDALYRAQAQVVQTPVALYFCPARRAPLALADRGLIDYASATGDGGGATEYGPYYGVIVRNPGAVTAAGVTDGLSNTFVIGEKRLDPATYRTGSWFDDTGAMAGWDNDIVCITTYGLSPDGADAKAYQFGSAHPGGMNAVWADGSVRVIGYQTRAAVLTALGDRRDGAAVELP